MHPRRRAWTLRLLAYAMIGALAGAGLGYLASSLTEPGYDASAFLLLTPGDAGVATSEVQYAQAISQIVATPSVLADGADLPDADRVRADPSPNAPLIELVVNADSATTARRQAQATAETVVAYIEERADLLGFRAVVLAPAADGEPAGLSLPAYLVAGAAMGAVLGALMVMLSGEQVVGAPGAAAHGAHGGPPDPPLRPAPAAGGPTAQPNGTPAGQPARGVPPGGSPGGPSAGRAVPRDVAATPATSTGQPIGGATVAVPPGAPPANHAAGPASGSAPQAAASKPS